MTSVLGSWCRARPVAATAAASLDTAGWEQVVASALRHGVAGLVHQALSLSAPAHPRPPEAQRAALAAAARRQAAAHAWEERVLAEVLDALAERDLRPVLLRGHALVGALYGGDGSLRPQLDHDLLVAGERVEDARRALGRIGFTACPATPDLLTREGSTVDLHRDPYDRTRVPSRGKVLRADSGRVLRRAVPASVAGRVVLVPCPDDRLPLLAVHVVKHSFDRLIRLVDVAECVRSFPPDAGAWIPRAVEEGTADALYYALAAARARLGAPVPDELLAALRPAPRRWVDGAFSRVLRGRPSPGFAEILLLRQLAGWGERATALGEMLWPPEERARLRASATAGRLLAVSSRVLRVTRRGIGALAPPRA